MLKNQFRLLLFYQFSQFLYNGDGFCSLFGSFKSSFFISQNVVQFDLKIAKLWKEKEEI